MRRTVSVTFEKDNAKTRKQAQNALNARISELTGNTDNVKHMPLSALCAAYIAHQRAHVAPQTVKGDEFALKAIIDMLGEDTDINIIDARMITEALDASGETPTRKNYRLKTIKKLFRWAFRYEYIKKGDWVMKLKRYKDNEKSRREFKYLEQAELKKLLDAMTIDKYRLLTEFLALTGLRIGEALALTADDFDLTNRKISINKTLSLVTNEIGDPKTDDSNRVIHMQTELLPVVNAILPECFTAVNYPAYCKYLKTTTMKVLGRSLTPHALRHTHISLLAAHRVPLDSIAHRCGHSDSDITRKIYMHVTQKMKDDEAAMLDAIKML